MTGWGPLVLAKASEVACPRRQRQGLASDLSGAGGLRSGCAGAVTAPLTT